MSIKRKLKRAVKKAAPLLAVAGLGKAFMDARNRRNQMKDFLATEGGDLSDMSNMIDEFGMANPRRNMKVNPAMMLMGVGSDPVLGDLPAGAKKGGRIMKTKRGGKAVRGFAKKKKQANKMRKK
jgi:hypothetical protein